MASTRISRYAVTTATGFSSAFPNITERSISVTDNKTSEAQLKAIKKYKEKMKRFSIDFSPAESDIWDHIQSQPKKQTYIKNLIREDMKKEQP